MYEDSNHNNTSFADSSSHPSNLTGGGGGSSLGIVYCCAQPSGPNSPTFEWSSLEAQQKITCRRVVQRILARIETTSFGERRQYMNEYQSILLLSMIGVDKCIFVVGCMRRDSGVSDNVAAEMDRLLVQVQRAYAQHIQGSIAVGTSGRIVEQNNSNQNNNNNSSHDVQQQISHHQLESFNNSVQQLIDLASEKVCEIVAVKSMVRRSSLQTTASIGMGVRKFFGGSHFSNFSTTSPSSRLAAAGGAGGGNNNNQPGLAHSPASTHDVNRYYATGAAGVGDGEFSGGGSSGGNSGRLADDEFAQDVNDDEDLVAARGVDAYGEMDDSTVMCCSTKAKFVICMTLTMVACAIVFVLLFACRHQHGNATGWSFSC